MKTFRIVLARTEYRVKEYIIEAKDADSAIDQAWDMSGNWQVVEADEFTESWDEIITKKEEIAK